VLKNPRADPLTQEGATWGEGKLHVKKNWNGGGTGGGEKKEKKSDGRHTGWHWRAKDKESKKKGLKWATAATHM